MTHRVTFGFSSAARQRGMGLIEVLVAAVVLSIGFLGMAALEATALSTNNSAMARSMVTINSYSILESMRDDIVNAKNGSYNGSVNAGSCPGASGSLAGAQLHQWCTQLGQTLGAVATTVGKVACDTSGTCTITIKFDDSRSGTKLGSSTQQFVTQAVL
jgi:type IV pilus assembly protein PilV